MTSLPLIRHDDPAAVIAYRSGDPIEAAQFLADVRALSDMLPTRKHVVNRCADRYHFAIGLAAALVREQLTLLPPNDTPDVMRQLAAQYHDVYCLTDEPVAEAMMDQVLYPPTQRAPDTGFVVPSFDERQIAALIFTSGSTGQPTPHARSWGILVRSAARAGASLGISRFPGAAVLATVSPQHSYGLESSVMLPLQHRLALTSSQTFYSADIIHQLEVLPRPRILVTTPIHLRFLTADSAQLPHLDLLVSATAPLSPQLASEAEARFHAPLIEIYGCAEAGQTAHRRPVQDVEWHCLEGLTLSQDEHGTWVRGDILDRETLLNDVIELHGPDRFVLHGRKADLVNIAGKRSSLAHLNYHLNAIEGVVDGAFVIPQGSNGSVARLIAFVVAPTLSVQAVKAALRERIDPVFLPRPLCLVDALPRNPTGKLARAEVDRLIASRAAQIIPGRAKIVFASDEAFAAGHFPGDPIVPGAILLQEVLSLLQTETERFTDSCEIRAGKFLRPVRPGDCMDISWAQTAGGDIRFDCSVREQAVLTGVIGNRVAPS